MDKQTLREEFLSALESGEYEQTKGQLCNNKGYCCLGVACEVYIKLGGDLSKHIEEDGDVRYGSTYYSYLPDELVNAYGFYDVHGVVEMNKNIAGYSSLVTANDGGISFAHLAKEIRKDPSAVFKD